MGKKFKNKYIAIIAAVVLVAGLALVAGDSYLFQGRLGLSPKPMALMPGIYRNAEMPPKPVSAVVSPVPSVVTSPVPSTVGPSQVVSQVPSVVVSGVASAVPVDKMTAAKVDVNKLPKMTKEVLQAAAKADMRSNPKKYTLPENVKKSILEMYKKTSRAS